MYTVRTGSEHGRFRSWGKVEVRLGPQSWHAARKFYARINPKDISI